MTKELEGGSRESSAPEEAVTVASEASNPSAERKKLGRIRRLPLQIAKGILYVAFVAVCAVLLLWGLDYAAKRALLQSEYGRIYSDDFGKVRLDLTKPVTHYDYDLVPGVCLVRNRTFGNDYEYANNAGFREPRDIPLEKPDDEFRIFLTGGSTAFGLGATGGAAPMTNYYQVGYRETISHFMEMILNATAPIPGKTIRVYNTAVWGYSYQHLLIRYMKKLRRYNPDLVVSFDGANEISPVSRAVENWNYFEEGQYNEILRQIFQYERSGLASYLTLWLKNNSYLMTMLWQGNDLFQVIAGDISPRHDSPQVEEEFKFAQGLSEEARSQMLVDHVTTLVRMVENYHSALQNDGTPHIFALQPLLYLSKKPRHEMERRVEALGEHKDVYGVSSAEAYRYIIDSINQSAAHRGYFTADFSEYFDDVSEWVFTDWCHLTAGANFLVAKELSNLIKLHFLNKTLSEWDQIHQKDSFFWKMGVAAKVLRAPEPDDPANGPRNMLTGYPGPMLYSSALVPEDQPLEVVLDLQREFKVGRLRIVWPDTESVPEEWVFDVSTDGKTWTTWVKGSGDDVDDFSCWPGFEFMGHDYKQARFVRYRPTRYGERRIRIRCVSIQK